MPDQTDPTKSHQTDQSNQTDRTDSGQDAAAPDDAAAPRRRRRAASRPAGAPEVSTPEDGAAETEAPAPRRRATRKTAASAAEADSEGAGTEEAPAPARARRTRKATASAAEAEGGPTEETEAAPARRRATRKATAAAEPAAAEDAAPEEAAAPARTRRTRKATAPAGAPAASAPDETAEAPAAEGETEAAPARARRRATRKSAAPAETTSETAAAPSAPAAPEAADEPAAETDAAPPRARRRATRQSAAPAPAAEAATVVTEPAAPAAASEDVTPAAEDAAPPRARRRATRQAAAPAPAGEAVVESAPAAAASEDVTPAAEDAAPPRARRRATRQAAAPAPAGEAVVESAPAAAASEDVTPAAEDAAPPRARRRATRQSAAPAPAAEAAEAPAAPSTPAAAPVQNGRTSGGRPAEGEGRSRRRGQKGNTVATFSAGEGSRRLRPGSLAPQDEAAAVLRTEDDAEPSTYIGKPFRDGDGWGVEIQDAYEIRGYGETVEDATAEAAAAVAEAFGVPFGSVTIELRGGEEEQPQGRGRRRGGRPAVAVFQPPVFQAPAAVVAVPVPEADAGEDEAADDTGEDEATDEHESRTPRRRRRRRGGGGAPEQVAEATTVADEPEVEDAEEPEEADDTGEGEDERPSRRRRRGGRRRRRGDSTEPEQEHDEESASEEDEPEHDEEQDEAADEQADDDHGGSSSSRRRRRRRRRGSDGPADDSGTADGDDPERTVVKVREPRPSQRYEGGTGADEVQSIKGSTRLEAKKQRRREGREQGRRRVPIITEAEFLARREAVERVMVVRQNGERTQIGVLEDNVLVEHYVNKEQSTSYVGNVYLGKVQNVLPSMEAAFVDIGKGRNAVLYAGEVNFEALGHSGGPRRIEAALKSGQSVLVQVTKDPIGHKGARLTSQVSLPGRYLVYVPEGSMTGISRKLPDTERARLKTILKKIVPEDAGVIVRTAAEGASEDELRRDVERLQGQWSDIQKKAKGSGSSNAPTLLYGEPDMTVRVVRDIFNEDFTKVIVSGDEAWSTIHEYVANVAPDLVDRLTRWTSEVDVFATYRIDEQLLKALDRKVWLPSGGSLVIDKTEAMVVVDVNTGKFTGQGGNLEETVTRNNLEAAEEIVRQLRLRDLGGIVVIDFIDMVLESNRDLVMRRLLECLGRDRTKHQVAEVTSLGLVQMTRKRVGQGLLESFSETCVHCNGRGVIVHMDQATTTGGGGKRKRRGGRGTGAAAGEHDHEHVLDAEDVEVIDTEELDADTEDELPELEPIEVGESELVPSAGDPEEEWFGSAAEAEAAAGPRGRSRRRGSRKATAPAGAPPAADREPEPAVVVVPVSEPVVDVEPEVSTEPPARTRRRATRKATAPAGSPAAADEAAVVVVAADPVVVVTPEPESVPEVSTEPPTRTRRRATRKVTAPAGSPAAAEDAAVVVVPNAAPAQDTSDDDAEPKKRAPRKAAAKKTAKKAATKKAAAKKTTAKKAATKKAATSAE
ncbi:Rne/Rng family ribonuclease [Streptomyces sp. NBC_01476]|uniref:Rne/Rng family ribonuclease n=1 Tax=Streptomyces sp. NBC_01476 TaxID=2903881 RepID=UPI002E30B5B9|nr:Rne/Rng family ribonuclease [Streptomyces sp. NBC_01476]